MKIPAKVDYACRALLQLALHWPKQEPLQIQEIALKQQIPIKFLTHILIELKQHGYVESTRGKNGGYFLIKNPKDITLKNVMNDFKNLELLPERGQKKSHVLSAIWKDANKVILNFMDSVTFADLCSKEKQTQSVEMYTI